MKARYRIDFEYELMNDDEEPASPEDIAADAEYGGLNRYYLPLILVSRLTSRDSDFDGCVSG